VPISSAIAGRAVEITVESMCSMKSAMARTRGTVRFKVWRVGVEAGWTRYGATRGNGKARCGDVVGVRAYHFGSSPRV